MRFCGTCLCRAKKAQDARLGWLHDCDRGHKHDHRILAVLTEDQCEQLHRLRQREAVTA